MAHVSTKIRAGHKVIAKNSKQQILMEEEIYTLVGTNKASRH